MASRLLNLQRQLQWRDFTNRRSDPPPGPDDFAVAAYTSANFDMNVAYEWVPGTHPDMYRLADNVTVTVQFRQRESWVETWVSRRSAAEQSRLLRHEQGHYDLVALLARDMFIELMELKQHQFGIGQAVVNAANNIRNPFAAKSQTVQDRYDTDTSNGDVQAMQNDWNGYIQTAFSQPRSPPEHAPDGTIYKTPLLSVLQSAGISI